LQENTSALLTDWLQFEVVLNQHDKAATSDQGYRDCVVIIALENLFKQSLKANSVTSCLHNTGEECLSQPLHQLCKSLS